MEMELLIKLLTLRKWQDANNFNSATYSLMQAESKLILLTLKSYQESLLLLAIAKY